VHENTLRAIRREMMQVLRGCAKALLSARRVTRPAPPGVGPFFEGSGGWSWAQAAVAIDPPKSVRGCVATSVSPTPAIAPTKMREVLRMDQQAFVIFTSVAPTRSYGRPLVCQDYGSCTPLGAAHVKKAAQRTGLSLQKEAITSWKGILTGHCAFGPNSAKHAKSDKRPRA
jgi:hypothetical protein